MEIVHTESMAAKEVHAKDFIQLPAKSGAIVTSGSVSSGNKFVRAIDQKARSYLRTLERSFSSSMDERLEDPASMTIEFLRARLQIQRTEYKLEKERAQQLERKVLELEERLKSEIQQRKKAECNNASPLCSDDHDPSMPLHCNEELNSEAMSKIDPQTRNETHHSFPLENGRVIANGDNSSSVCPSCYRLLSEKLDSGLEQILCRDKSNSMDQDAIREILPKQDICYGRCLLESVPEDTRDMTYRDQVYDENMLYQQHQKLNMKSNNIERKNSMDHDFVKALNQAGNHYRETGAENHLVNFRQLGVKPLNRITNNEAETFVKGISLEDKPFCNQGSATMVGNLYHQCTGHLTQSPSRYMKDQPRIYYSDDSKQYAETTRKVSFNLSPTRLYNLEKHPRLCNSNAIAQANKKQFNPMCDPEAKAVKAEMVQYLNSAGRVGGLNWVKSQEFYASLDDVPQNPVASRDMQTGHTLRAQGRRMSLDGGLDRLKHVVKALDAAN